MQAATSSMEVVDMAHECLVDLCDVVRREMTTLGGPLGGLMSLPLKVKDNLRTLARQGADMASTTVAASTVLRSVTEALPKEVHVSYTSCEDDLLDLQAQGLLGAALLRGTVDKLRRRIVAAIEAALQRRASRQELAEVLASKQPRPGPPEVPGAMDWMTPTERPKPGSARRSDFPQVIAGMQVCHRFLAHAVGESKEGCARGAACRFAPCGQRFKSMPSEQQAVFNTAVDQFVRARR